jgi:hypothetical protein
LFSDITESGEDLDSCASLCRRHFTGSRAGTNQRKWSQRP